MWQVRRWIPWTLVFVLTALAAAGAVVGLTSRHGDPTHRGLISPFFTPARSLTATQRTTPTTQPPQAGYRTIEDFCASSPLSGHVVYNGTREELVPSMLGVAMVGLPPNTDVSVDWSNDYIRGYIIATFRTDSAGAPIPSSVDLGRLPEVRGVAMVLESTGVPPVVYGHLDPC